MGWKDRLNLGFGVALAAMPLVLNLLLLVWRKRYLQVAGWRYWTATVGLILGLLASFPTPLFYLAWICRGICRGTGFAGRGVCDADGVHCRAGRAGASGVWAREGTMDWNGSYACERGFSVRNAIGIE